MGDQVLTAIGPLKGPSGKVVLGFAMRTHTKKRDEDPGLDFNSYSDREVMFFGIPYSRAKLVNNVWYQRTLDGGYRPFSFQQKVQEVGPPKMTTGEDESKTDVAPKTRTA